MAIVLLSLLISLQVIRTLCIRGKSIDDTLDACGAPELDQTGDSELDQIGKSVDVAIPLNPAKQPPREWHGLHGEVWRNRAGGAGPRVDPEEENGYGLLKSPEATAASLGEFDNMKVIVDLNKHRLTMISYYQASKDSGLVETIIEDRMWIGLVSRDPETTIVYDVDRGYAETGYFGLAGYRHWVKFKVRDRVGGKSKSDFHSNPRYKVVFANSGDASDFQKALLVCDAQAAVWANMLGWSTPERHHPQETRVWKGLSGWAWRTYANLPGFANCAVINPGKKGSYGLLGESGEKASSLGDFVNMQASINPRAETLSLVHFRSSRENVLYEGIPIKENIYDVNRGYWEGHTLIVSGWRWWVRFKVREDADEGTSRALHWSHSNPRFSLTFKRTADAEAFQEMLLQCGAQGSTFVGKMANSSWSA